MQHKCLSGCSDPSHQRYEYSAQWRAICEARYVCRLPTKEARQKYIEKCESKHGTDAANRLRNNITEQWNTVKNEGKAPQIIK